MVPVWCQSCGAYAKATLRDALSLVPETLVKQLSCRFYEKMRVTVFGRKKVLTRSSIPIDSNNGLLRSL